MGRVLEAAGECGVWGGWVVMDWCLLMLYA